MADLPSGSTIGGEKIIHIGNANDHRHHASDINGLSPLFYGDEGHGGGIDANVLSGKSYSMLEDEFLGTQNDSISELFLNEHPTNNNNAASLLYLKNSIPSTFKSGEFYGITSIGSQSSSGIEYSMIDNYTIRINSMDVLMNGHKTYFPTQNVDIRTLSSNFQNKTFYLYLNKLSNSVSVYMFNTKIKNTNTLIYFGMVKTDSSGITSFTPIENEERIGVGSYMLSKTPNTNSIIVSRDNGYIDDRWILGSRGETIVDLRGKVKLSSGVDEVYTISNYDSFSTYSASTEINGDDVGIETNDFVEENITIRTPLAVPFSDTMDIHVYRNGVINSFPVELIPDPETTITGVSEYLTGGQVYTYTIGNYNENYAYTASSTDTDISIDGDTVTVITPATLPDDVSGSFTVERDGSSTTFDYNITAVPPFEIVGKEKIWQGGTFEYTIDPYDPQSSYDVTCEFPSSFSDGVVSITAPAGTSIEYEISLTVESNGVVVTIPIVVLGDPDPFYINNNDSPLDLYEHIGYPQPALHYTFYISGTIMLPSTSSSYAALSTGGTFSKFTEGTRLTIYLEDVTIASHGGNGGKGSNANGQPGGTCINITTPTTLYLSDDTTIIAGGGGGGSAVRYTASSSIAGKGGGTSYTVEASGPGGGGMSGVVGDTSSVGTAKGDLATTPATEGTHTSAGLRGVARSSETETRFDSNENPYDVNHTFSLYGGKGGSVGQSGYSSTGSSNVENVKYSINGGSVTSTSARSGRLGAGGASGAAIKGNGKLENYYTSSNTQIIGPII